MIEYIFYFVLWTFILYWIHRAAHANKFLLNYHRDHHKFISVSLKTKKNQSTWHWNNLFLFNDTMNSTIDLWLTEVIPTLVFSILTGQWWISIFYYCWAAIIQERIEHDITFDLYPVLTSGKSHLVHHSNPEKNYGLFFPIWDKLFNTFKHHDS
jgi:sterol desaturase/sphingolipid hydroxylase (fatty acid hydroxylase superfamily)